jgi:hypothetical protein
MHNILHFKTCQEIKKNTFIDVPTNHFVSMMEKLSIEFENHFQDFKYIYIIYMI